MPDLRGAALAVLTSVLFATPSLAAPVKTPVPAPAPAPAVQRQAMLLKEVPTQEKLIAFTFDDGPNRRYTPQVLELLQKYHAHATFFLIGQEVVRFPEMVKKIEAAGMEIGNHGMNHKWLHKITADEIQKEITGGSDAITSAGGKKPYLYRLPGGFASDDASKLLGSLGYTVIGWSVDTRDWRMSATAEGIERIVMRDAAPGRIVIMHDGSVHREGTIQALSHVLPALEGQGYKIVSIGELLQKSSYQALRKLPPQKPCGAKKVKSQPKKERPKSFLERLRPTGRKPSGRKAG
jgi:peptidoglycan/xylan/chitin deacetylase (PgdA/CDA1 family)